LQTRVRAPSQDKRRGPHIAGPQRSAPTSVGSHFIPAKSANPLNSTPNLTKSLCRRGGHIHCVSRNECRCAGSLRLLFRTGLL